MAPGVQILQLKMAPLAQEAPWDAATEHRGQEDPAVFPEDEAG